MVMIMMRIVNLRTYKPSDDEIMVRIDRANPILGNPHYLHRENERDMICDLYDMRFERKVKEDIRFISELERIVGLVLAGHDVVLGCWCVPKRCHGEIILEYVRQRIKEEKNYEGSIIVNQD